jgi:hypothetical protein
MRRSRTTTRVFASLLGTLAVGALAPARALTPPSGEPFAVEATALVPLDAESAVAIVGIKGRISVSTLDGRELRVVSRTLTEPATEQPVGIWQDGSRMIVAPEPGGKGAPRILHVEVPKTFAVTVDAADSDVSVQSEGGGVDLHGTNLRATIQTIGGLVGADVAGGSLTVRDSRDATVRVKDTAATLSGMSGNVSVHAAGGTVGLSAIGGATDLESEDTQLELNGLSGAVHLKAQKGDAKVAGVESSAELAMAGTPLHLKDGKGDITVTSDAPVDFQSMAASLHFDMYGGSLRGKGNQGILEVRTRNTEVNVEAISDGMRIQGEGLTARIVDVGGELYVETNNSDIVVDRAGNVILKIDRGNVTVQRAVGAVNATVVGADVHVLDASGTVTLDLDRGEGEVSWASFSGDKDSQLINQSGGLTVRFPASGGCRVEAKSKNGRIDSDLPTVKVMDDLKEAQGPVNNGYRPIVHIVADGDIHLQDASTKEP